MVRVSDAEGLSYSGSSNVLSRLSEALSDESTPASVRLGEFLWTTTLFSVYNLCALRAAVVDRELVTRTLTRNGKVNWRNVPRNEFERAVSALISRLMRDGIPGDVLRSIGLSISVGAEYFDYLQGELAPSIDNSVYCPFALGCVLNGESLEVQEMYRVADHATPLAIGGVETQSMCTHHNHVKGDNLLFDHKTLWNVVFNSPTNPME